MSGRLISRVTQEQRGVAMIEFALIVPLLLLAILGLSELANIALQRQRVSQAALLIADNAGRIGNMGMTGPERVTEDEINDALISADIQQPELNLPDRARVILTSLEANKEGGQWLHWQRCRGALVHKSSWGEENDGEHGKSVTGMGPSGGRITADAEQPVMFVEIAYQVQPLILSTYANKTIVETAAMPIRVERDTSSIVAGDAIKSRCK